MARKAKPDAFAQAILANADAFATEDLSVKLGELVLVQQHGRAMRTIQHSLDPDAAKAEAATQRAKPRRVGKNQRYETTMLLDTSRPGTFRKYMIRTIRDHKDTASANAAHAKCDNPKFAKNKLDFRWAADNGYIRFI